MTEPRRNSYFVILLTLLLAGWFGLGTPLVAAFFASFVLHRLTFLRRKSLTVLVCLVLVSIICSGLVYFLDQAVRTLPRVATTAIPSIIQYAQERGWDLPFTDWGTLKTFALENIRGQLPYISNSIIVAFAFTVSPNLAIAALIFLVLLHKLEYFLNSKIIGERIKNPVWLTLIGLILGERLMGITGMILAPVILNYIKTEACRIKVQEADKEASAGLVKDGG